MLIVLCLLLFGTDLVLARSSESRRRRRDYGEFVAAQECRNVQNGGVSNVFKDIQININVGTDFKVNTTGVNAKLMELVQQVLSGIAQAPTQEQQPVEPTIAQPEPLQAIAEEVVVADVGDTGDIDVVAAEEMVIVQSDEPTTAVSILTPSEPVSVIEAIAPEVVVTPTTMSPLPVIEEPVIVTETVVIPTVELSVAPEPVLTTTPEIVETAPVQEPVIITETVATPTIEQQPPTPEPIVVEDLAITPTEMVAEEQLLTVTPEPESIDSDEEEPELSIEEILDQYDVKPDEDEELDDEIQEQNVAKRRPEEDIEEIIEDDEEF